MGVLDAFTGVAGAASGVANTVLNFKNYEYQKDMQREAWNREDNAVQRRASDLEAAGLSKTLAAGSAASSSNPIKLDAPQVSEQIGTSAQKAIDASQGVLQLMQQKKQIAQTQAQTDKIKSDKALNDQTIAFNAQNNPQKIEELGLKNNLSSATLKDNIESVQLSVQKQGYEKTLQGLKQEALKADVSEKNYNVAMQAVRRATTTAHMKHEEQELIAQQIAIDLAKQNEEERRRNINIYKESAALSDQQLGQYANLGIMGAQALKGAATGTVNAVTKSLEAIKDWSKLTPMTSKYPGDMR